MSILDKLSSLFKKEKKHIDENNTKVITEEELLERQKIIDEEYAREGLTDSVLDKQVELNKLRHELNIPDRNNFIYEDFVQ